MNGNNNNPFLNNITNPYAQLYQNLIQQANQNQPVQQNGCFMNLVEDEMSVLQWRMGPNESAFFYNPNIGRMWLKNTDGNGVPNPIRTFKLTEITNEISQQQPVMATLEQTSDVVTRSEFNELVDMIKGLKASVDEWNK